MEEEPPVVQKIPLPVAIKKQDRFLPILFFINKWAEVDCLGFAPRSQSAVFGTLYLSTSSVRYPNFASLNTYANPLEPDQTPFGWFSSTKHI